MNASTINAVSKAIAALDLSDLNDRLAKIDKRREDAQEAERRAEDRCTEISRTIRDWRGVDSAAIADALVGGDADQAASAAVDIAELEAERAKLREGIGELRRRAIATYDSRQSVFTEARGRIGPLTNPLIEELQVEAEQAAQTLLRIWASATAISRSTGGGDGVYLSRNLENAVAVLTRHPSILGAQAAHTYPVPAEIVTMLQSLQAKGPALPTGVILQVPAPQADVSVIAVPVAA